MASLLVLEALPTELQLCVLGQLNTRFLLTHMACLSKHWFALVGDLVRQRTVELLGGPGVSLVFETSNPSDYRTRVSHTLTTLDGLFEPIVECASFKLPQLSLSFTSPDAQFDFKLDEDEHFGSLLWSVCLVTHRSVRYRVSPPASPKLVSYDRATGYTRRVQEGLERLRRGEFPVRGVGRGEERELDGEWGSVQLAARMLPVVEMPGHEAFGVRLEGLRVDAASVVIANEDGQKGGDLTVLFCG